MLLENLGKGAKGHNRVGFQGQEIRVEAVHGLLVALLDERILSLCQLLLCP